MKQYLTPSIVFVLFWCISLHARVTPLASNYLEKVAYYTNYNNDSALMYVDSALLQPLPDSVNVEVLFQKIRLLKLKGALPDAIDLAHGLCSDYKANSDVYIPSLIRLIELNRASLFFNNALLYGEHALEALENHPNKKYRAEVYNRIAAVLLEQHNDERYSQTPLYADSSVVLSTQLGDTLLLANNYEIIGAYYRDAGQCSKSGRYFLKAYELFKTVEDFDLSNILINIALNYSFRDQHEKAIDYGVRAYEAAMQSQILTYVENNSQQLSRIYKRAGDFENAYYYIQEANNAKIELYFDQKENLIADSNQKYEAELKEQKIKLQNHHIEQQQMKMLFFIILAGVGVLMFIIVLTLFLKLRKASKTMVKQQAQIELQNSSLEERNQKLQELDEFKKTMSNMLAHDLKNTLVGILLYSKNEKVKNTVFTMERLIMNFLDVSRFEDAAIKLKLKSHNLEQIFNEAISQSSLVAERKGIKIESNVDTTISVKVDKGMILRTIVNILDNALKYSSEGQTIWLNAAPTDDSTKVKVSITDVGAGISSDKIAKVFNKYYSEKSTGLGLAFCKMAVEAHGETIKVESEPNVQTQFAFTLPIG